VHAFLALVVACVPVCQDTLRQESLRQESVRQESVRQETVRQETVDAWFPRLESASWVERDEAQRRLAGTLEPADAARVRAAILLGGAEARLRLAHVLGDEDRLLGTAAQLAVDADSIVARVGSTGLRLAIERFVPPVLDDPIPRQDLWIALAQHDGAAFDVRARPGFEPTEIADLFALAQPGAPRIVFDTAEALTGAESAAARVRANEPVPRAIDGGAWRELARNSAQLAGGKLVGFGVQRATSPDAVRWLAPCSAATSCTVIGATRTQSPTSPVGIVTVRSVKAQRPSDGSKRGMPIFCLSRTSTSS
jgi:hypothetical protein